MLRVKVALGVSFLIVLCLCCSFVMCASAETVIKQEISVTFPDVTRTGVYSGEVNDNGKPDGFGVFEAVNGEGNRYIIVGEWVDGHMTGQAWEIWENGDLNIGQFEDGHFVSGKYARDVKIQKYDERPRNSAIATNEATLISYEDLLNYGESIDPSTSYGHIEGSIPVKLEAIVTSVDEGEYGITVEMWMKGEKGYYYNKSYLSYEDHRYNSKVSMSLQSMQRIALEVTPYSDGTFYSDDIYSLTILEDNVDIKEITPAEFKTFEELSVMNMENSGFKDKESGVMEIIVGDTNMWVKGKNGYVSQIMAFHEFSVEKGQRWYVGADSHPERTAKTYIPDRERRNSRTQFVT